MPVLGVDTLRCPLEDVTELIAELINARVEVREAKKYCFERSKARCISWHHGRTIRLMYVLKKEWE